jgi:lipid II:glycine glycyltransferase (peptidoglycan interpeptide bridge formation enzyme)
MISPLALIEPSASEWDAFVAGHPQGELLQQTPWAELKGSAGWEASRIGVLDASGTLRAGAQLLTRKRYGLAACYTPRGPLWSGEPDYDSLLLAGLRRSARRRRAIFLRLEPNLSEHDPSADSLHSWLLTKGLQPTTTIQPRSTIQLQLAPDEAALFASFSKGHRADIRRAERQGVTVRVGTATDLPAFYAIMQATGVRAAFGIHSEAYYRQAWAGAQPGSQLLLAELGGEVVAAHMVFAGPQRALYLYGGAIEAGLKAGANHLLQWAAIRWAREYGCASYDFWGIPDALGQAAFATDEAEQQALAEAAQNDPLIGVYRFKKGFGGQVVRFLPAYDEIYLPPLYALWQRRAGLA